jgi:Ser/Thr protein kinase RdoA (MazF antagonist)
MAGAVEEIASAFAGSPLPATILGTTAPDDVAEALGKWCERHVDASLDGVFRCEISVGVVFGVSLSDGRRTAVKAHPRTVPHAQLVAVHAAQRTLAGAGFPCPRPLAAPAPFLGTLATAEAWVDGAAGDFDDRATVAASAAALAEHLSILGGLALDLPPTIARSPWPPTPHNALFDFSREPDAIRSVAEIARRASTRLGAGEVVTGHSDWSAKHVRIDRGRVVATYDWDSLRRDRESVLVGFAAACHHVHLDPTRPWRAEAGRVRAFLDAYVSHRALTPGETSAARAAAVYLLAYTARCEHGYLGRGPRLTEVRGTLAAAADDLLERT